MFQGQGYSKLKFGRAFELDSNFCVTKIRVLVFEGRYDVASGLFKVYF
jgi:hypothetical protein